MTTKLSLKDPLSFESARNRYRCVFKLSFFNLTPDIPFQVDNALNRIHPPLKHFINVLRHRKDLVLTYPTLLFSLTLTLTLTLTLAYSHSPIIEGYLIFASDAINAIDDLQIESGFIAMNALITIYVHLATTMKQSTTRRNTPIPSRRR